jgi:RecA/RadA recombinase
MSNRLLARLRENDKRGLFRKTQTSISYRTGFSTFDYRNGYMIQVKDNNDSLVEEYPSVGILGGSFVTIIGKPGTAKSTFAIQAAANIVRPFPNGFVQHYDLERATTYTRVRNVTGFSTVELEEKYVLKQEESYIEDILDAILAICKVKEEERENMMYDTKLKDEFGNPIMAFVPTVVIIDSIPVMASKEEEMEGMAGMTYANRVARALSQFYNRLIPVIKSYNIIVIAINHLKTKININPMQRTQPQLNYLGMDESIPGGFAPLYYANTLVKFTSKVGDKRTMDKDGFNGFDVRVDFLKSRTNMAGQYCDLVYNQMCGFDHIYSQYAFAQANELIGGKNPKKYVIGYEDIKFDDRKLRESFMADEKLRFALYNSTIPLLEKQLSRVDPDETSKVVDLTETLIRLSRSQEGEAYDEVSELGAVV